MMKRIHLLTVFTLCLPLVAMAASFKELSVEMGEEDSERIAITASEGLNLQNSFTLTQPDRVVVDFSTVSGSVSLPLDYRGRLIKAIRVGQFNAATSRLVVETTVPVAIDEIIAGNPLVVELSPEDPLPPVAVKKGAEKEKGKSAAAKKASAKPSASQMKSEPAAKTEKEKPLIAIDAGHGGQDPGAIGAHDTYERDVTLAFAQALRKALLRTGRYRVALTREDDHFVMLHDRVALARKAQADLMVSLHADSNPRADARGLSIYTLSATASDDEAAALAERENKADVISGMDLSATDQDVANILIDLTQRETMNKSTTFADAIVSKLHPKITRLPGTHRFAGFRVLKAPDIPSVLIELGFLSNPNDERLLQSLEYRDLVVESVIKGIDRYYTAQ